MCDETEDRCSSCEEQERGGPPGDDKVMICHIPPGNPSNPRTLIVSEGALQAHLDHGDSLGMCEGQCDDEPGD